QNDVTLKMPAFEWVHVQLHQQKGMISLSPPTICNSAPRGAAVISRLSTLLEDSSLPLYLSQLLLKLQQHYHYLVEQIKDLESQLKRKLDEDEVGQRLLSIPCVGTLTASTISTEIGDGKQYASSRDFAA
ncbi:transposase, partial [Enterobacter roggenkampii]|uniref:transposase n=1 Tax=Enterobacter roggenkampii TaxID=1812935 RepID=UPI003EB9818A